MSKVHFLKGSITEAWKSLVTAFAGINFSDNFISGVATITLTTTAADIEVRNPISPRIPTEWMQVDTFGSPTAYVRRGSTTWTSDWLYFRTDTAASQVVKIRVFA